MDINIPTLNDLDLSKQKPHVQSVLELHKGYNSLNSQGYLSNPNKISDSDFLSQGNGMSVADEIDYFRENATASQATMTIRQ